MRKGRGGRWRKLRLAVMLNEVRGAERGGVEGSLPLKTSVVGGFFQTSVLGLAEREKEDMIVVDKTRVNWK